MRCKIIKNASISINYELIFERRNDSARILIGNNSMNEKIQKERVSKLTLTIRSHWKNSVASLIEVGKCLNELKTILQREKFLLHLDKHLSMSEMQANRLINLYKRFHDKKSIHVLSARPSVLYLMASGLDLKKLESLAKGGKVFINNKYKTLSQLSIEDVHSIKDKVTKEPKAFDVDEKQRDLDRAQNAHRHFATLLEELSNWINDLDRYKKEKIEIKNKDILINYINEVSLCMEKLKINLL